MKKEIQCCSFCGMNSHQVSKLIGSSTGHSYIDESCAKLCCDIFQGKITPDDALKGINCKKEETLKVLKEVQDKILNKISTFNTETNEIFARILQTIEEANKILIRAKNNLTKPETLGKVEEDIDIVIDMLTKGNT